MWTNATRRRRTAFHTLALLVLCVAMILTIPLAVRAEGGSLVIRADRGGLLGERSEQIRRLRASGQRVELRGDCYSACTMYLGLPDVCVSPSATFGFHGPSWYGRALSPREFEHWSQVLARNYREPLRTWFLQTARYEIRGYFRISGEELIRMGYPRC